MHIWSGCAIMWKTKKKLVRWIQKENGFIKRKCVRDMNVCSFVHFYRSLYRYFVIFSVIFFLSHLVYEFLMLSSFSILFFIFLQFSIYYLRIILYLNKMRTNIMRSARWLVELNYYCECAKHSNQAAIPNDVTIKMVEGLRLRLIIPS